MLKEGGQSIASVIDLGTGTGLLAIAAAKLGVMQVTAVDNNPLACEVARRNVALNNCQSRVTVVQADLKKELPVLSGFDLVIANLYKGLLQGLFAEPRFWRAKAYLLSGFIAGMEGDLLAALPAGRIKVLARGSKDMWRLWLLRNKSVEL